MPKATEAMAFIDNDKHMECLGGMRTEFLTNDHFVHPCNAEYPR